MFFQPSASPGRMLELHHRAWPIPGWLEHAALVHFTQIDVSVVGQAGVGDVEVAVEHHAQSVAADAAAGMAQ